MFYPDLNNECQVDHGPYVRAIGWLSVEHPYSNGDVAQEFLEALRRQIAEPWQPVVAGGVHRCEFCKTDPAKGCKNVWIPGARVVYVAPELVLHYIEAHGYRPPDDFITAVINCPEQKSEEYVKRMQFLASWAELLGERKRSSQA